MQHHKTTNTTTYEAGTSFLRKNFRKKDKRPNYHRSHRQNQDRPCRQILCMLDGFTVFRRDKIAQILNRRINRFCRKYHSDGEYDCYPFQSVQAEQESGSDYAYRNKTVNPGIMFLANQQPYTAKRIFETPHAITPCKSTIFHCLSCK